ncbi:MAG: 2,3-bisphosphoglycerate-independent phosphoglycerate mutase [Anaerolineales bacterium]|nr:MAG: 2,3-bisphosphoglycerate-independent phosphoglycerate mutase [Anaerolineales bacterium]
MADFELMRELQHKNTSKIVLLVMDGLGGIPLEPGGHSALEAAKTPNLDRLAGEGTLGQFIPIRPGITPGSGPAHLALFGYDPLAYEVGRGVLEATGIGMEIGIEDVAARGNFCTLDSSGNISDRRADRISSDEAIPLVQKLDEIELPGVSLAVRHVREYRFAVVMRGADLSPEIADTDPQATGVPPLSARADNPASEKAAEHFNRWIERAGEVLSEEKKANGLTLRGFSSDPRLPQFTEIYGLRSACIAVYPMYQGVSRLVGMDVIPFDGDSPEREFETTASHWDAFDFFFIHIKKTDSSGEDGDIQKKAKVIEDVDKALPALLNLNPDVLAVTGDHSTPAKLKTHSWHPVPFLLWAPDTVRMDSQDTFGERSCQLGGLGTFPATDIMPLLMAHAKRLQKFGA